MNRLLRNIGWLLTGRGLNALLSLVYLALATRTLGLDNFGYFAIILALGQTVTGIANFQTWQFVVRWGADGDGPADATGFAIALDLLSIALGLVLAEPVLATEAVPPFANTAMDGFAVRAVDTVGAPVRMAVVGTLAAGDAPDRPVGPGEAIRIMTGAPMPPGADAVVMVELTSVSGSAADEQVDVRWRCRWQPRPRGR